MLHKFLRKFLGFMKATPRNSWVYSWNCGKIARKFWRNLKETEKKSLNDSRKIITLSRKTEAIRNWCWYYKQILKSFSQITSRN